MANTEFLCHVQEGASSLKLFFRQFMLRQLNRSNGTENSRYGNQKQFLYGIGILSFTLKQVHRHQNRFTLIHLKPLYFFQNSYYFSGLK